MLKPTALYNSDFQQHDDVWWYGGCVVTHPEAYNTPREIAHAPLMYIRSQLTKPLPITSLTRWKAEIAKAGGVREVVKHLNPAQFARFQLMDKIFFGGKLTS